MVFGEFVKRSEREVFHFKFGKTKQKPHLLAAPDPAHRILHHTTRELVASPLTWQLTVRCVTTFQTVCFGVSLVSVTLYLPHGRLQRHER